MFRRYAVVLCSVIALFSFLHSQPKLLWTITDPTPDSVVSLHDAVRDYSGNILMIANGFTKYSNTGSMLWRKILPSLGNFVYKMTTDKQGNVYIVVNNNTDKQTLMKYSPSGDSLWAKTLTLDMPSGDYRSQNRLITSDGDGNVYIAVQHEQRKPGEIFKTFLMVSSYTSGGQLRWLDTTVTAMPLNREPEYGDLMLSEMLVDGSGNIIISLASRSEINPSLFIAETKIVKYSSAGGPPAWVNSLAISGVNVEVSDIDVDAFGNIFVAYNHMLSLTVGGRIRKISSSGATLWDRMTANSGAKIASDNNGGVYAGIGRSLSFTTTISRIFRFNGPDSTFIGNFGIGNYSLLHHLAVDPSGFVVASGVMKQSYSAAEGSYLFTEFTPEGQQNGSVVYSSPGVSYEYPHFLFQGNGTYNVIGQSVHHLTKSVLWINKISVVPNPPAPPDPQPEKGWATQNSGTTADLYSVWFKQGSEGWAVGDSGTILHTMDAGNVWTKLPSPVQSDFKEIKFFNDTLGFIVGTGGIIRTGDGGVTWTKISETGNQTLYAIAGNDSGMFVAVGTGGLSRNSTDWGNTWATTNTKNGETLRDVEHFGGLFVAAGDNASVYVWPTVSGWATINSGGLFGQNFRAIQKKGKKLYLYGSIIGEVDEKFAFRSSIDFPPTTLLSVTDDPKAELAVVTGEMGTVGFADEEKSVRYKTVSPYDLNDVFQSGSFAVVVGDHGTIINFNNRSRVSNRPNDIFFSLTMVDPMTFIYSTQNKLFRSSDGGNKWSVVDSSGQWGNRFTVNGSDVWGSVKIDTQYTVMLSTDKGFTWQVQSPILPYKHHPLITIPLGKNVIVSGEGDAVNELIVFMSAHIGANWYWIPFDTIKANHRNLYHSADTTSLWRENVNMTNGMYSLQKFTSGIPRWLTMFSDSVGKNINPYDPIVLPNGEIVLQKNSGTIKPMFHTVNGGITWKNYPSSIPEAAHLEHKTFANWSGFDLRLSTDGNFSHKTGPDYFFTRSRDGYKQREFGSARKFSWMEEGQIIFEHPLQIDTNRIIDRWTYLASQRKKAIGNPGVAVDTIIVAPGTTGNVLKNIVVLADKVLHTAIGDLTIVLSHNSISDTLFHQLGFSADNMFNVVFSDASTADLAFVRAPFSGEYRPFSPLQKFIGSNPAGAWILKIYDKTPADSGMLEAWSLKLESDFVASVQNNGLVPSEFSLSQNYPNPFNPSTTINYQLPMNSTVSLKIYDVIGREVATLVNDVMNAGSYSMPFNASRFASGVYFYRIEATATNGSHSRFTDVKKMILLK
ncbi:MAG: YCF48-related protein [Bacteroidota bacterium]